MADLIELVCECGKVLRVPKSRAGQTGKCAKCKRSISIPMGSAEAISPASQGMPSETGDMPIPPTTSVPRSSVQRDLRSKTAVLMSPLAAGSTPLPWDREQSSPQSPAKEATPFESPAAQEEIGSGKNCPRCGKINRQDVERCQFCKASFEAAGKPSTRSASKAKPTGKIEKRKRLGVIHAALFFVFFIVGVVTGILLSPGYFAIVPPKAQILAIFSKSNEKDTPEKTLPQPLPPVDEIIVESRNPQTPITTTTPDTPVKPDYDKRLKADVETVLARAEAYLASLKRNYESFKGIKDILNRKSPGMDLPEKVTTVERAAEQWEQYLTKGIQLSRDTLQGRKWENLKKAYEVLRPCRDWNPETHTLLTQLRWASEEVAQTVSKLEGPGMGTQRVATSQYIGSWHGELMKVISPIRTVSIEALSFDGAGAQMRFERVQSTVNNISKYPHDVQEAAQAVEKAIQKGKDVQKWVRFRTDTAQSRSQVKQAEVLEKFVREKKFNVEVKEDIPVLRQKMAALQRNIQQGQLAEETVKEVLQSLQRIQNKYEEEFQDFNSAVINFEFWNP